MLAAEGSAMYGFEAGLAERGEGGEGGTLFGRIGWLPPSASHWHGEPVGRLRQSPAVDPPGTRDPALPVEFL